MKIDFSDTHVSIGSIRILDGVSLTAKNGEVTGIVGPNGSGKSTLIKTLFSLVPYQNGEITLDSRDVKSLPQKEIARQVGYVGQEMTAVFDFSVREIVAMGRFPHQKSTKKQNSKEIVDNALDTLGIMDFADRSILTLSGGEKKLVYLARTIAQEVDTIVLDEPTNHLDIKHQLFILDFLKQSGKTILVVLHDLSLAARYCDTINLMKNGKNIGNGSPKSVLSKENIHNVFGVNGTVAENKYGKLQFELY